MGRMQSGSRASGQICEEASEPGCINGFWGRSVLGLFAVIGLGGWVVVVTLLTLGLGFFDFRGWGSFRCMQGWMRSFTANMMHELAALVGRRDYASSFRGSFRKSAGRD